MSASNWGSDRANSVAVATGLSIAVAAAMIAQQVAGKTVRDAYFLTVFEPEVLARVMTAASILSIVAVVGVSRLYRRYAPARLVPAFFGLSAGLFLAELGLVRVNAAETAAILLYLHTASMGVIAISGFWVVMNECYDPHTAKRVLARVGSGATVGGMLGGVVAWQGAAAVSVVAALAVLAIINGACAIGIFAISRGTSAPSMSAAGAVVTDVTERGAPWRLFEDTPYLRHVAVLVALMAFGTAGIDYAFKATVAVTYADGAELVSFFALFYLATGIGAFVVQSGFAHWFLRRFGIAPAIASLPLMVVVFGPVTLFAPGLFTIALLRGSAATIESSSYRAGYELLYTPVAAEIKRPAKTLIDVGGDKLGAALGSACAVFLVGLAPSLAMSLLVIGGIACALVALGLSRWLSRGYVNALAQSLSIGQLTADELADLDPKGQRAVAATIAAIDTRAVEHVRQARDCRAGGAAVPTAAQSPRADCEKACADIAVFLRTADAFAASAIPPLVGALRHRNPLPRSWLGVLVPALGDSQFGDTIAAHLIRSAPAHLGALIDALLDPSYPVVVRCRIADVVSHVPTQRCANELLCALLVESFDVRIAVANALGRVVTTNPQVRLPRATIIDRVREQLMDLQRLYSPTGLARIVDNTATSRDAGRRLDYCLTLLSTFLSADAIVLSIDALATGDERQWGTGLEYMENVLPDRLRDLAVPVLRNRAIANVASGIRRGTKADLVGPFETISLPVLRQRLAAFQRTT